MRFVILRLLRHNELGMFHAYRRKGKERAKQRAINFDGDVVDRVRGEDRVNRVHKSCNQGQERAGCSPAAKPKTSGQDTCRRGSYPPKCSCRHR